MTRLIILVLGLFGGVLFSSANADVDYPAFYGASEAFVQNIPEIDFVGSFEISESSENEEEEETEAGHFYLNSNPAPFFCEAYESCSNQQKKKNLHQLIINLFTNLPPPLSEDCQYL